MAELQPLVDAMLGAAATVFGRLVEQPAAATPATRNDHEGSVRTDGDDLVTLVELPGPGAKLIVRFRKSDLQAVVGMMLGGAADMGEMGPMQLSIASETVSQIAVAMAEQLAKDLGVSADGIRADLCTDAGALPPPPFESYDATVALGEELMPEVSVDFAAITRQKLGLDRAAPAPADAPAPAPAAEPSPPAARVAAQSVAYTSMAPTTVRTAQPGQANLDMVHDVPLQISAVLGKTIMPLREVVSLQSGAVFELDKLAAEPIDLYVNNILIARGEVVVVDEKYAVKISELNPTAS